MKYDERKNFSKLMLDNIIAAYEKSQIGVILQAPFNSTNDTDWNDQLKIMRYLKVKFDFKDELKFN